MFYLMGNRPDGRIIDHEHHTLIDALRDSKAIRHTVDAPTMPIGTVKKAPLKVMEELSVTFNCQALKGNEEALDYRLYFSGLGL